MNAQHSESESESESSLLSTNDKQAREHTINIMRKIQEQSSKFQIQS